ncbi:hypothetical protein TSUD_180220 [Trifolium subterraneum]|uniref:DUF7910 domain-containing protein n=1 Tax=Trifolium subterraneum TaxID=3900 RepID=A0A2Z6P0L3_TRISU|nr:hypothetical protein TSUD_180220 [Trifolium subterraneum]
MGLVFTKWASTVLLCCFLITSRLYSVEGLHIGSKVRGVNLGGWLLIEGWIKPSLFDGIANGDLLDGTQVHIKSITLQKYVSAENGGGMSVTVDRDVPSSWETFRVREGDLDNLEFKLRGK